MVVSMTGFGSSKVESKSFAVTVEVKTVNHRFSEFAIRMPRQLLKIEDKLKKAIIQHMKRGRAEVHVSIEGEGLLLRKLHVDWDLIDDYIDFLKNASERYKLDQTPTLSDLSTREEFVRIEESDSGNEELEHMVLQATREAALLLKQMRLTEGIELEKDLKRNLARLKSCVGEIEVFAPAVIEQYRLRLQKRMDELIGGQKDETRLMMEIALFADRADINEELTRLNSHIEQFLQVVTEEDTIGRKLDFLVQEMNREANTIGSKANDSDIAKKVVEMKSLLEKLKEQVQNIE